MYDKIWLAGLGAYSRYEKLGKDGKKLFEELVEDGEAVRERATGKIDELKDAAKDKVQDNISRIKELLNLESNSTSDDIKELTAQVEELNVAVKALAQAKPAAARKTSAS
ncbi:phasin family protein [Endozoicomonadaceae bacterium StTr2]